MMRLTIRAGPQAGQECPLGRGTVTIGRATGCEVLLTDPYVSGRHAQLTQQAQGLVITDLRSQNGTFVNGQRITAPHLLKDGDCIRVGQTEIVFSTAPSGAPAAASVAAPAPVSRPAAPIWPIFAISGLAVLFFAFLAIIAATRAPTTTPTIPTPATPSPKAVLTTTTTAPMPTATLMLSPTATRLVPTATPVPPTATSVLAPAPTPTLYPAPRLLSPRNGARFQGERATVVLEWEAVGTLAADEYYVVSIPHREGVDEGWVKGTSWPVPAYLYNLGLSSREYHWSVVVRRHTGFKPNGQKDGPVIGQVSETRSFFWDMQPTSPLPPP